LWTAEEPAYSYVLGCHSGPLGGTSYKACGVRLGREVAGEKRKHGAIHTFSKQDFVIVRYVSVLSALPVNQFGVTQYTTIPSKRAAVEPSMVAAFKKLLAQSKREYASSGEQNRQ